MSEQKHSYLRPAAGRTSLTVDQWVAYAKAGADLPVTTLLSGSSMEPLIRYRKDPVTVIPLKREPVPGDIVLFRRQDGAYVVHRFYRALENGMVQTWGDNCIAPDAPVARDRLLGLVICFERNGKRIDTDTPQMRRKGVKRMEHPRGRRNRILLKGLVRRIVGRIRRYGRLLKGKQSS